MRLIERGETITLVLLVIVFAGCMLLSSSFRDLGYLLKSSTKVVELCMVSLPMTLLIIAGMIDLSVTSIMALSATMTAYTFHAGVPFGAALMVGLVVGSVCGLINGSLIAYGKLPPMIVTIGTQSLFRGICQILIGDASLSDFPEWFNAMDKRSVFMLGEGANFSVSLLLFVLLVLMFYFVLHHTTIGRMVFAIGTNEQTAIWSGIKTKRVKLLLFVVSGFICALSGILTMSRFSLVRYDMQLNREIDVITIVLLGGASISGGKGSIIGTFLASILMIVMKTGLIVANITADSQMFVVGVILLVSVIAPQLIERYKARKD